MLEGLCNPHMHKCFELSFNRTIFKQIAMISSINGLRFCSSQTLSHLLNSSCFILGQNLQAFVYQNIRSCCTSTKCFLEDLCKYHFRYIIVHVVCMVNKAASYSTIALPDHPPVSPFLDPQSLLISCSPTEPYPSLHHVVGIMTYHQNSAPFLYLLHRYCQSQYIIFIWILYPSPPDLPLKTKMPSLQIL